METIGILQFLQSLLSSTAQNQPSPSEQNQNFKEEKTPQTHDDIDQNEPNRSAQDAILQFLEAHDKRANKYKK